MQTPITTDRFLLLGNQPTLDFVNTEIVVDEKRVSLIEDFEGLLDWLKVVNLLDPHIAEEAQKQWSETASSGEVLAQALALRTKLRDMAGEIATGQSVAASTLAAINDLLRMRQGYEEVVEQAGEERGRYLKRFRFTPTRPEHLLVPIAEAASDLLCNTDFTLIRRCENPACILYFYDTTKNHARRWCSMGACGNRHKQAAHYRRTQGRKE